MPTNDLIIALSNSNLNFDPTIIPLLWKENHRIPENVVNQLLTALELSAEEHPEILNILLAECGPNYTVEMVRS